MSEITQIKYGTRIVVPESRPITLREREQMRVVMKIISLRLEASMFGVCDEAWVRSHLTDDDHAALAKDIELATPLALPEVRE